MKHTKFQIFLFIIALVTIPLTTSHSALTPPNNVKLGEPTKPTLFVDAKVGKDTNPGTEAMPFRTIQKAADVAKPGDRILIREGVYQEFVTMKNSGSPNKRIIFEGERGPNGEYLSIIDPSISVEGWEPAPEVGKGVYKTNLRFDPKEMVVDNKRIGRISDRLMAGTYTFYDMNGEEMLSSSSNHQVLRANENIYFWDGIEVLYGFKKGTTFIRFRNGNDPNLENIKASNDGYAVDIKDISYNTIKNIKIAAAPISIRIKGKSSSYNIVEDCYLMNGNCRVRLIDGISNNIIRNNTLTMKYYSEKYLGSPENSIISAHVYKIFKFAIGSGTSNDHGIRIIDGDADNIIENNYVFGGLTGITNTNFTDSVMHGLVVRNNIIENMSSIGIAIGINNVNAKYYGNIISNCSNGIRIHDMHHKDNKGMRVYIYNNIFYSPGRMYFFTNPNYAETPSSYPEIFIYHNNFAGWNWSIDQIVLDTGGLKNTYFINNIWSGSLNNSRFSDAVASMYEEDSSTDYGFGLFSNNWIGGYISDKIAHNLRNNNYMNPDVHFWGEKFPPINWFDYLSHPDVINCGIDLSKPFAYNKNQVLPGMSESYSKEMIPLGAISQ